MERSCDGLVFRWLVGLNMDEPLWGIGLGPGLRVPHESGTPHTPPRARPLRVVLFSNFPSCEEAQLRLRCGREEVCDG